MDTLQRWLRSIGTQISAGFLLVAALALVVGTIGYFQVNTVKDLLVNNALVRSEALHTSTQLRVETTAASGLVREYPLQTHPDEKTRIRTLLSDRLQAMKELLRRVERLSLLLSSEERAQLASIEIQRYGFDIQALQVLQACDDEGQYGEKTRQAMESFESHRDRLLETLVELEDTEMALLTDSQNAASDAAQMALTAISILSAVTLLVALGAGTLLSLSLLRRLTRLREGAAIIGTGDLEHTIELRTGDELEDLAEAFNAMARSLRASRAEIEKHAQTLEQRVEKRTQALGEMVRTQQRLLETIREMSVPVVPIMVGVIVLPLVGTIDSERAGRVVEALLEGIEAHRARVALVDITGVPVVDTQVAHLLLEATTAARLLGTQVVLVGIRPEVAQTIVGLGIDLSEIVTRADLQGGVEYAQRLLSRKPAQDRPQE